MKYKIFSDLHIDGPHELKVDLDYDNYLKQIIYLGDIFDCKNSNRVSETIQKTLVHQEQCRKNGIGDAVGNHERLKGNFSTTSKGVLFTHGHFIFWSREELEKYFHDLDNEVMPKGAGFFRRLGVKIFSDLREVRDFKMTNEKIKLVHKFKRIIEWRTGLKIHTVCFGHTHPKELIDFKDNELRIINVPRGITEIEL